MFSLICAWINGWINNRGAGDLRRHRAHYYAIAMTNSYLYWPHYGHTATTIWANIGSENGLLPHGPKSVSETRLTVKDILLHKITSSQNDVLTTSRRRFDVTMALLLRRALVGEVPVCPVPVFRDPSSSIQVMLRWWSLNTHAQTRQELVPYHVIECTVTMETCNDTKYLVLYGHHGNRREIINIDTLLDQTCS